MSGSEGKIVVEQAYAQGKMLDHSGFKHLPRGITPSDIDMVIDSAGDVMFCELSRNHNRWKALNYGQRLLYENLCISGQHICALLTHSVNPTLAIRTHADIDSYHVMFAVNREIHTSPVRFGFSWPEFAQDWIEDSARVRQLLWETREAEE